SLVPPLLKHQAAAPIQSQQCRGQYAGKEAGPRRAPRAWTRRERSDLFLEHRLAARLADLVDEGLHLSRRFLAHEADDDHHQEAERHPQQSAVYVVEIEPP